MGHLLDWLLDKNNKETCRLVGIFLVIPPLAFKFGGGFHQGAGWFHEWFSGIFKLSLSLMFFLGLILILAGFSKRKSE